jgi:hypothetical protein
VKTDPRSLPEGASEESVGPTPGNPPTAIVRAYIAQAAGILGVLYGDSERLLSLIGPDPVPERLLEQLSEFGRRSAREAQRANRCCQKGVRLARRGQR